MNRETEEKIEFREKRSGRRPVAGRILPAVLALLFLLSAGSSAFAAGSISEKNIRDGLAFCQAYPVTLSLDGQAIAFGEKDVPPVIITPDGASAGHTLIPARALFEAMGAQVAWVNETQSIVITHQDFKVTFIIGETSADVNGEKRQLDVPALIIDHDGDYYGSTMIPVRFAAEALGCDVKWVDASRTVAVTSPSREPNRGDTGDRPQNGEAENENGGDPGKTENPDENRNPTATGSGILTGTVQNGTLTGNGTVITEGYEFPVYDRSLLPAPTESAKRKLVMLDPGHGGKDNGSTGHRGQSDALEEKDLNLAIGLRVREYLDIAGMNTAMVRESDTYIEKTARAYKANAVGADLYVSFHNNSSEYASPQGTETHYNSKLVNGLSEEVLYGITSESTANYIQAEMIKALGTKDRGTKSSPELAVLNKTEMPAVLIEGAFLSNEEDFRMMKTEEFIDRYAFACAKGIILALSAAFPD